MTAPLAHPINQAEETNWVAMACHGDREAFNRLAAHYQRPIFNLCYRMLGNRLEAEDAAQEAFMRAYLKLDTYNAQYKFSTWLFSIAAHYCLDRLKMRRLRLISWVDLPPWSQFSSGEISCPEMMLINSETAQEVNHLLQTLQPDYRAVVTLKYWHDMSCEEIAQALRTTPGAVKSKLFRARQKLAEAINQPQTRGLATPGRPRPAVS